MTERMRELFDSVIENPSDLEASGELEQLLVDAEDWAELLKLQLHLAEHAESGEERTARLRSAADAAERMGEKAQAVELLGASLETDETGGLDTLRRMRLLLQELEEWDSLIQVAEAEVERLDAPAERADLLYQVGELIEEKLGDAQRAMVAYQAAFQSDPACLRALYAARRIYRQDNNWEMVARLLELELGTTEDDDRRAEILQELGNVVLYDLDQPELARQCFDQYLKLRPDDDEIKTLLDELGGPIPEAEGLDEEATVGDADAAQAADDAVQAAEVAVDAAEDAIEAAAEAESAEDEDSAQAAADAAEEAAEEAVEAAEDAAEAAGEAAEAADEDASAADEDAADAADAAEAAAEVAEEAAAEAAAAAEEVAEETPVEPERAPEEILAEVEALEASAEDLEGRPRLVTFIRALALLDKAGGVGDVARLYLEATKAEPTSTLPWRRIGSKIEAPESEFQKVVEGLEALSEQDFGGFAGSLKAHALVVKAGRLGETKGVDYQLREMAKDPSDEGVIDWQIARLVGTNKWRNVQQLLADRIGGDANTARVEALRQMARLAADLPDAEAKAADFWRQVHQQDKTDREARAALSELYRKLEKWPQYADILKQEVEDIPADEPERKIAGLRKLVQVYTDNLNQDAMLVQLYDQILELDPADEDATAALLEKYESMRRWPDLVKLLEAQQDRAEGQERIDIGLRIADLYLNRFRNQAEAINAYEAVLEQDPDNRTAIEALVGLYEKRREWDKLVAVRRQLADMSESLDERVAGYIELAEYATKKIRKPELCLDLWVRVREMQPENVDALRALVTLYDQAKDWPALAEAIDELVDQVDDEKEQADLLQKSGQVLQDRMDDKARAVGVWKRLLAIDPSNRRANDSLKKALIELNDWDALTEYFGAEERWDELVRILEGQVGVQKEDEVRIELLFRSADIWRDNLEQSDRQVRALERVLQLDPQNVRGARALEPIYEENSDHRKLANVLEILLDAEEDGTERRNLMLRLANENENFLRNPDGAFEWARRVVQERPADAEARAELTRLGGETNQWATVHEDLVQALDRVSYDDETQGERLPLLLNIANILDEHLGSNDEALHRYHEALELDPENITALDAVDSLYTRTMNWHELLGVVDRRLALADSVEDRKALLRKQGVIYEEQLDDPNAAIERYIKITEEDENDLDAIRALHRLYEQGGQFEELHDVLQRELQLVALEPEETDPGIAAALKMQIGVIDLQELGRTSEAVDNFRDILAQDPDNAEARSALEGLLGDPDYRAESAKILEPIYRDSQNWEALVSALEIQLEETREPERRVELLERIGVLHVDRTVDIERAFHAFARMLREQPDSRVAVTRLTQLADAGDKWFDLAQLLEEVTPDVSDTGLAKELLTRLAEIYEGRLTDADQAIDAHRRVLELEPTERNSIESLDRLYQQTQQWPELLAIYRRKLELSEDAFAREALQFQIANLLEEMLGDNQEAIRVYGEIAQNDPQNGRALQALDRLYDAEGMAAELADVLTRQLELAEEEDDRTALRVRLGALQEGELGMIPVAIETYKTVLDSDPDNDAAREALERLVQDPDHRAAIADILEPIYERRDEWHKLVEVYEIQREESADSRRKVELLHRIANLHATRGGDAPSAFESYARAFMVDPSDEGTLAQLHRLAETLGMWDELVGVYRAKVHEIDDPAVATDVHKRVAKVLWQEVQDADGAREHYEAAYENDDTDLEVISALEEIYFQGQQWHELVSVLLRKSQLTEDPQEKKGLYFRVSAIYEEMLEDPERAVETFQMVLEVDEVDARALDALERIYVGLERWEDLMEVLHKKAQLTEDLTARKEIYYTIGSAYERELDDLTRAVETYQTVLSWDEDDLTALQALDRLYYRLEYWEDLHKILVREVAVSEDEYERLALRYRIANLKETSLDDIPGAIEGYREILADQPSHEETLQSLEGLVRDDREAAAAAAVLEPVLTEAGAWNRMIDGWGALLDVTTDLEVRTKLRLQIGQAYEDMLLDTDQAFVAYGDAFREDPTHQPTLVALERVAARAEMWPQLVELIEAELVNIHSDFIARDLYIRVARVFEEELGSNVDAIERYRRVLELDPEHEGAVLALDRLYSNVEMWADLAEILQLRVEREEDADRVPLLLRLGALQENALDDVPAAIQSYKDVLAITHQEPVAVGQLQALFEAGHEQPIIAEVLEPIYLENEDWHRLHELLRALLEHQHPGEDRMRAMHRLAEISLDKLEDQQRAFEWYGMALKEVPEDEKSRTEVARLAAATERYMDQVAVFTDAMQNTQDVELIRSMSHEMATVYRQKVGDPAAAEQMYLYVLDGIDPADQGALAGVDSLYVEQERWSELVPILQREIEATYEDTERLGFMYRLGEVYETYLAEIDEAVEQYRGILLVEPHHSGALTRLENIYLARQEWEPLFEIYQRQAEVAEHDADKAQLYANMANLASEFLGRPHDAIDLWNQVLDLSGENADALMALEGLYQVQESWRELVDVCERQVNLAGNNVEREVQLYSKLGRVWGDYLERERNALENWQKVLDRQPENEDAVWAIRDLHERTGDQAEVAQADHRLLELLAPDDPRRLDLFRQLGLLYQEALDQPARAVEAWTNLLALSSHDPEAIDSLEELYQAQDNWAAYVEILDRKVDITQDTYDQVSILFRVAETYEERLEDPAGAQRAYARILELQPDNIDAFQQLERLYEAGEQHEDLVGLLLNRLEQTEDAFERQELYVRTAKTFEDNLLSTENAFLVLGQAFGESRDDDRFGQELERLAAIDNKWAELITLYEQVLSQMGSSPETVPLHLRVARWYDEKLDQAQHAGTHYQHVLAIEPDNISALTALELLLERYENWPKVVEVLRQKVDLSVDPDERQASLVKMAGILEEKLDQPDEAIEAYRQVLMIDPSELNTLKALERLYALRQRYPDLIETLEAQATVIEDPRQQVDLHLTIGELWEARLGSPDRAIDAYRQALAVDETCVDAMTALEKLYTQQDRWHDLLDVFEMKLLVQQDPAQQLRTYGQIATIQEEELGDPQATIDTYRRMVSIDPSDETAVRALDRLYRDQERWDELADVYQQHLAVLEDGHAQIRIRTALGDIFRTSINDPFRAIEALTPILEIDANHRETLFTLGELYAQTEDWHNCIDVMAREAQLLSDRQDLLDRQFRVGDIYREKLGDLEQAERWYRGALDHDPNYAPALGALRHIYEQRGEWTEVIRTLKMMEAATRSFTDKSKSLYEIGNVYYQHLDDRLTGIDYYEQAMDLDPENADAAAPLMEVYWNDNRWERAEPLLDLLVARGTDGDLRALQQLHYRLAFSAEQLHKDEKAIEHYRAAYELDSTYLPTLQGMGNLLFRNEHWDRAFKIYQTVLVHHRESLKPEETVDIFHRQGAIKLKVGERRKALDFFRKALDIDPQHRDTLGAVAELHEGQGDWDDVVHYRRQLLPLLDDDVERFQSLVNIGDVLHEQLRNPRLAIQAYNEALALQEGSKLVLSKLLDIHQEAGNWPEAVNVLQQFAELETNPEKQAKYWYAVGAIQRDYLKDHFTAVRTFDKALEAHPAELKAFQAIVQLLTQDRDFERQDRYYRKMLKRATEHQLGDNLIVKLASDLGEINRSRLQRYDEAIKAYKIALSKDPENAGTHQILAELYELENSTDKAIAEHYRLIKINPRNVESYQNLRRLFMDSGRYDEAWCVCRVLTFLERANPDERAFYEKHRTKSLKQARRPLDKEHWQLINHPEKSALLDQLLMLLYDPTVPVMALSHKELRLHKRKDLIDPNEQTPFNNIMKYVAQVTRLPQLESYKDPHGRAGIRAINLGGPALMVGADVLSGPRMQELAFINAKALYLTGGRQHFLANLEERYESRKTVLITAVQTLTKLVNPSANVQVDAGLLQEYQQRVRVGEQQAAAKLIQKMGTNPQHHLNVSKWLEMTEYSANRLGFLLSDDLGSAVKVIRNEPGQFSRAPADERIRDIVIFALSENYFQLRKALALAIG